MEREKLFKKYSKSPYHTYSLEDSLSVLDDTGRAPDVLFVYSGRNRGKSFEIATHVIADAWYDKRLFVYVRRNDSTTTEIEEYFDDKHEFIQEMTNGARDGITQHRGKLYFYKDEPDEKTGKVKHNIYEACGKFIALSWRESSIKSLQFPEYFNILYEEVLSNDPYVQNEPDRLFNLFSTVFRSKTGVKMYLISNLVNPVNPYSKSWGINIAKNKPGTVRLSKLYLGAYGKDMKEQYILIACHYLENLNDLNEADRKLKRNRIKTGISSNKWDEATLYHHVDLSIMRPYISKTDPAAVFEWDDMSYLVKIINVPENILDIHEDEEIKPSQNNIPIMYVMRKTSEPLRATRVYTNNGSRLGAMVTRGFRVVYKFDQAIKDLTDKGWIIGTDNLCMNEFSKVYQNLRLIIN